MSIHTETVQVELNSASFDASCEFEYYAGEAPKLTGLPENCHPGEPAEVNILRLAIRVNKKLELDISDLLEIDAFCEDIVEQIEAVIEEACHDE